MGKIIILVLLGLLYILPVFSNDSVVLDIDSAIKLARENNIELKRAEILLTGKKIDVSSAYNVFYPKISGSASLSRSNTDPETYSEVNLSLGYNASFTFTPALFDAITLLKKNYEIGEISYNKAVKDLEVNVKEIFYNIILLKEQASLLEDNLKTIEKRYNLTQLNFDAGLVSELELLQVQVSFENFKPELNNLNNILITTIMNFKSILGIPLDTELIIDGEINPVIRTFDIEEVYNIALNNNRDLKSVEKLQEFFIAQKKATFSKNFLPVFQVAYSSGTFLNDPFAENSLDIDNFSDDSGALSLSLLYSFNSLFPNSAERVELEKIQNSITDSGLQESALLNNLKLQITNSIYTLNNSINIQNGLDLTVKLAKKSLDKVHQSYNSGSSQLLEVENAENEYKKARLELLKEKFKYTNTILQLESICAQKLF